MEGPDDCLTNDELTSLLEGREPGDERDRFMAHLDRCPDCRMVLAESAQHLETERDSTEHSALAALAALAPLAPWVRVVVVVAVLFFTLLILWALRNS